MTTNLQPHDFATSLRASHVAEDLPFWEEVYRKAFPTMVTMVSHREDGQHQREGIDRSVILKCSKQLLVDEKVRFRNKKTGKIYEDIALEYLSDEARRAPGWVCKSLLADYIAYAIAPLGKCYLLPVPQLQEAWRRHGEKWLSELGSKRHRIRARNLCKRTNRSWDTLSVPVSPHELFQAMGQCLRIEFDRFDSPE